MAAPIKGILNVVVIIAVVIFVLNAFGILGSGPILRIRR
jgi:hypothetical protein